MPDSSGHEQTTVDQSFPYRYHRGLIETLLSIVPYRENTQLTFFKTSGHLILNTYIVIICKKVHNRTGFLHREPSWLFVYDGVLQTRIGSLLSKSHIIKKRKSLRQLKMQKNR